MEGIRAPEQMTEARKTAFLEELERTMSFSHAARIASSNGQKRPDHAFRKLVQTDPRFAEAVEEALERGRDALRYRINEIAHGRVKQPVFQAGSRVIDFDGSPAEVAILSEKLITLAARLLPEFREKKEIEHSGTITHEQKRTISFTMDEVYAMSKEEQKTIFLIMKRIREESAQTKRLEQISNAPEEVVEAEFTPVKEPEPWELLKDYEPQEGEAT